jgi:hypothetical protein
MEGVHRLLDGCQAVPAVDLVEVDVVKPEPLQRGVDRGQDVLAGEPAAVLTRHRPAMHLGRDHVLLAGAEQLAEEVAGHDLALPAVVDVGGVEEDHAVVDGPLDDRLRRRLVQRPPAGLVPAEAHHAEAHARDAQAGAAQVHIPHSSLLRRSPVTVAASARDRPQVLMPSWSRP